MNEETAQINKYTLLWASDLFLSYISNRGYH